MTLLAKAVGKLQPGPHKIYASRRALGFPDVSCKAASCPAEKSARSCFKNVCFNLRILITWKWSDSMIYNPARVLRSLPPYVPLPFSLLYTYHFPLFIFPDWCSGSGCFPLWDSKLSLVIEKASLLSSVRLPKLLIVAYWYHTAGKEEFISHPRHMVDKRMYLFLHVSKGLSLEKINIIYAVSKQNFMVLSLEGLSWARIANLNPGFKKRGRIRR